MLKRRWRKSVSVFFIYFASSKDGEANPASQKQGELLLRATQDDDDRCHVASHAFFAAIRGNQRDILYCSSRCARGDLRLQFFLSTAAHRTLSNILQPGRSLLKQSAVALGQRYFFCEAFAALLCLQG